MAIQQAKNLTLFGLEAEEMKIKKEMTKPLSILLLIITLFSFPSYAEEPATQQETSISQDKDVENMDIGELLEEIKNLDKEDIKK